MERPAPARRRERGLTRSSADVAGAAAGFGLDHLPYGVVSTADAPGERRLAVRLGDGAVDVAAVLAPLDPPPASEAVLRAPSLDPLLALGPATWRAVREALQERLGDPRQAGAVAAATAPVHAAELHLPFTVADYVDFYASEDHATNVGRMFRPDAEPLLPNWRHLAVGYHGRAGTVVVSGTPIVRPRGQRREPGRDAPVFGPTARLDLEAEVGFVVGVPSALGTSVAAAAFADHVFGICLLNDWSARDVQAFEYVPLGPFLGKAFATSVAAWVTPLAALEHARVPGPVQVPAPLPHLRRAADWGLDLRLEVEVAGTVVSRPPFRTQWWTADQLVAHLTSGGASLRTGDVLASGTVSGPVRDERGSLLELSWNGTEPVALDDGTTRTFLEDGDEVVLRGTAPGAHGGTIALGEVRGTITPARP